MADKFKFKKGGATVNPPSSTSKFTKPTTQKTPKQASQQSSSNIAKFRKNYDDDDDDDDDDGSHKQSSSSSSASSSSKISSLTQSANKKSNGNSRKRKRSQDSDDSDDGGTAVHHGSSKKSKGVMRKGKNEAKRTHAGTRGGSIDSDDDDDDDDDDDTADGSDGPDDHDDDDHGDDDGDGEDDGTVSSKEKGKAPTHGSDNDDDDDNDSKPTVRGSASDAVRVPLLGKKPTKEIRYKLAKLEEKIEDLEAKLKRQEDAQERAEEELEKSRKKFNAAHKEKKLLKYQVLINSYEKSVEQHTQNIAVLNSQITTLTAELKALSREARAAAAAAAAATAMPLAVSPGLRSLAKTPFPKGDLGAFQAFLDSKGFTLRDDRLLPFNGIRPGRSPASYEGRQRAIAHALESLVTDYSWFRKKNNFERSLRLEVVYGSPGSGKTAFASVMASFGRFLNSKAEFEAGTQLLSTVEEREVVAKLRECMFGIYITFNDMMDMAGTNERPLTRSHAELEYFYRVLWSHFCGNYDDVNMSFRRFRTELKSSFDVLGLVITDATDLVKADIRVLTKRSDVIVYLCVDELGKLTARCEGEKETEKADIAVGILSSELVRAGVFHLLTSLAADPDISLSIDKSPSCSRDVAKNFLRALTLPQLQVIVDNFLCQKKLQLDQDSRAHLLHALALTGGVPRLVEKVLLFVKTNFVSETVWGSAAAFNKVPYIPLKPDFDPNLKKYALMTMCLSRRTGTALDAYKRTKDGLVYSGAMTMLDSETVAAIVPGVLWEWLAHDAEFTHLPLAKFLGHIVQPSHHPCGIPLEKATVATLHLAVAIKAVWCNSGKLSQSYPGCDTRNWWTTAQYQAMKHEDWNLLDLLGYTSPSISSFVDNLLTHLTSSRAWTAPLGTFSRLEEKIIDSSKFTGVLDAGKAAVYTFGSTFPGADVVATIPCATSGQAIHVAFQCKLGTQPNLNEKTIAASLLATLSRPVSDVEASSLPLLDAFLARSFAFVFLAYVDGIIHYEVGVNSTTAWSEGDVVNIASPSVVAENLHNLVRNVNGLPRSQRAAADRLAGYSKKDLKSLVSSCYLFMMPSHFDLLLTPTGAASFSRTRFDFRVDLAQQSGSGTSQLSSS